MKEWNLAGVADEAELIISELMTNALKAARPLRDIQPITLHLQASHEHLMIQVWDALSAAPAPRPHAIDAETGRGLEIVSLLSERWGFYHPVGGGKVVWATLKISAPGKPAHEPATTSRGRLIVSSHSGHVALGAQARARHETTADRLPGHAP